jgi:hypothetical protein
MTRGFDYVDEDSSNLARIAMLCYVILSLIMCGGSVFGFTPLKEILLDEGTFQDLCTPEQPSAVPCESQLGQLDHMFTLAASLFSAYLLPAGLCLRFIGPRMCFLLGFFLVALGSTGFARAPETYYTLSFVLIGSGNPLLYISAFNFGKLYPKSSNLLLSVFIGCFGFSSVVFYVFHVLHFEYGLSSQDIFTWFSCIPALLGLVGVFVLPPDPYHVQRAKKLQAALDAALGEATERTPLTSAITSKLSRVEEGYNKAEATVVGGAAEFLLPLKERSIPFQLISPQFLAQTLFFCWGMLHQNFYLGTIGDQIYMYAGDAEDQRDTAANILTKFSFFYPMGCILAILPVGMLVRHCSVAISLYVYCTADVLFSLLSIIPSVNVQWATSAIYILVRVGFFTVMSTYSSTMFGFQNLGTMFGCAGCVAGMVSLLGTLLSDRALHVDHSFLPVNSILLAGAVVNFAFPSIVLFKQWQQP